MARLNVNPTRMELSKLKIKLVTAKKGHKLLKDKQDELMRIFIETIKENKKMREKVEEKLKIALKNFAISKSLISEATFEEAIAIPKIKYEVDIDTQNVMSVRIPKLHLEQIGDENDIYPYSYAQTSSELDYALEDISSVMMDLLKLSEIEKSTELMADEIEKTRRRVNALEYMTIPQLEETIKFIRMKLDENDRASIIRLMKANIN
ncbi:V-type ATP synthase subunit D [Pseudostreptobacillus hongkongensis]|uniref:V-type ATP synthase subunit D n=1 Tax=Pseudostreptobacillus hongkongensis TaxID=1162717 RepID=UPI00082FAB53|nr:V-type ATP synthase subunit D [Pseudostreptobacillus hongkongensis]